MTIEQIIDIPADRRLTLEIPEEIPAGRTIVAFTPAPMSPVRARPANVETPFPNEKPPTPLTDSLCGLLSHIGDISPEEIRAERLGKYLK